MKKKVLVYCDINWSLGRVNRSIEKWLNKDYEFTFHCWSKISPSFIISVINQYDIIMTNLCCINHFNDICLKKFIFICHGYPELKNLNNFNYPNDCTYSITSKAIESILPSYMNFLYTPTGLEPTCFDFVQRNGEITKLGWCGGKHVLSKRSFWTEEIANGTNLEFEIKTDLSYDDIRKWYNTIDILLVNAGPELWSETGPLPPFEAIVSGVLVIGTRVGNFKEIPGPKYETINEAINIINELKKDSQKVIAIMKEQYDYVINNWTYEKIINNWDILFKQSLKLSSNTMNL